MAGPDVSAATRQAIHDAIAAHIADENDGPTEYLTEWVVVSSSMVIADGAEFSSYWFFHSPGNAYHHNLGLLHEGLEYVYGENK